MIKLLFVQLFNSIGGAEIVIKNLISGLDPNAYECHCVFLKTKGLGDQGMEENPCPVYYIDNIPENEQGSNITTMAKTLGIDIIVTTLIRNPVRNHIKKYFKGKVVEIVHSVIGVCRAYDHRHIRQMPDVERFDCIVSVSEPTRLKAIDQLKPFRPNKILTIQNGIDTDKFKPRYTKKKKFTVGNVARISKEKNINMFFEIARLLPQFDFVWVGGILPMWEEYAARLMTPKPDNVTITGYIQKDIELEFNKLDMFILTSENEGMPLAVLEAMASRLPIISTKVGNLHSFLDRNCFYENSRQAAMLIKEFEQNKNKSQKYGELNKKTILEKYSIIKMVDEYDRLFKELMQS